MASFLYNAKSDGDLYFLCMFCSARLSGHLHQHRIWQNTLSKKSPIQVIPATSNARKIDNVPLEQMKRNR